jgi:surfeit locus 1 family protein
MNALARSLVWPAVFAGLAFALLVSLGLWQMRRLGEKEALIFRIETRAHVAPKDLPARADWPSLSGDDYDYAHVRATGRFDLEREALVFSQAPASAGSEPGYLVVTPFVLDKGGVVLVDRGFVAQSKAGDRAWRRRPLGETTITGLMRKPQSRNAFTPADDPERGVWYTRDPGKIAAFLKLTEAAPFIIALDAPGDGGQPASGDFPRPAPGVPEIANNHLSYAVTWFGLAFALAVVFAMFARGKLRAG